MTDRRTHVGGQSGWTHLLLRCIWAAPLVLSACSGTLSEHTSRVTLSPEVKREAERPLVLAQQCLEALGYEVVYRDFELGRIWSERTEHTDASGSSPVVNELHVVRDGDEVSIRASAEHTLSDGGSESVRVSERVRGDVERVANFLGGTDTTSTNECTAEPAGGGEHTFDQGSTLDEDD